MLTNNYIISRISSLGNSEGRTLTVLQKWIPTMASSNTTFCPSCQDYLLAKKKFVSSSQTIRLQLK